MREPPEPVLKVRFYRTPTGGEPVRDWLRSLGDEVCLMVGRDIARVQWQWPIGKPLVDGFGDRLYEVRSKVGKEQYRVFFYIESPASLVIVHANMVLVHGIHKKTQKTPPTDIELARRRKKEGT